MTLNELTTIWKDNSSQLDQGLQVNRKLFLSVSQEKIRRSLGEFRFEAWVEIIVNGLFLFWFRGYLIDTFGEWKFFVPGAIMAVLMLTSIIWGIYRLVLASRLNIQTSVVATQKIISRLRFYEKVNTNSLLVAIPLFAAAFAIVVAWGVARVDLYLILGHYLWLIMGAGLVIAAILVTILRLFPNKKLKEAQEFLAEIKEFENE